MGKITKFHRSAATKYEPLYGIILPERICKQSVYLSFASIFVFISRWYLRTLFPEIISRRIVPSVNDEANKKCKMSFIPTTRGSLNRNNFFCNSRILELEKTEVVWYMYTIKNILFEIAPLQFNTSVFFEAFEIINLAVTATHYCAL